MLWHCACGALAVVLPLVVVVAVVAVVDVVAVFVVLVVVAVAVFVVLVLVVVVVVVVVVAVALLSGKTFTSEPKLWETIIAGPKVHKLVCIADDDDTPELCLSQDLRAPTAYELELAGLGHP